MLEMLKFWRKRDDAIFDEELKNGQTSIAPPSDTDGAVEIEGSDRTSAYGFFGRSMIDLESNIESTTQLINTYRGLMEHYEVENTVQEIITDAIVHEHGSKVVEIGLDDTKFSQPIRDKIVEEFDNVLNLLEFNKHGQEHFKRWYVDSRIYFHKIININNVNEGIVELRRLDPRNLTFVREVITDMEEGVKIVKGVREYFLYQVTDMYSCYGSTYTNGMKIQIPKSAIVYAHSGLMDVSGKNIIGYLHRAIKPSNQLKMLEDAMVIYRLTRSPDRRVFYIDTGNMPSKKATQFMVGIKNSMKNRVTYDSKTGKIKTQQNNLALTEDFWLQRRDGKAVTEVETLPGMTGMNEMDDVRYFRKAMYLSLRVPLSRIPDEQTGQSPLFDSGTNITRDEVKFDKFVTDLQHKFSPIMLEPLRENLILKKIISAKEWDENINNINIVYHKDSYFAEVKNAEIEERRIALLQQASEYIGKYISHDTAMKKYLQMSEQEISDEAKQIELESKDKRFNNEDELE